MKRNLAEKTNVDRKRKILNNQISYFTLMSNILRENSHFQVVLLSMIMISSKSPSLVNCSLSQVRKHHTVETELRIFSLIFTEWTLKYKWIIKGFKDYRESFPLHLVNNIELFMKSINLIWLLHYCIRMDWGNKKCYIFATNLAYKHHRWKFFL